MTWLQTVATLKSHQGLFVTLGVLENLGLPEVFVKSRCLPYLRIFRSLLRQQCRGVENQPKEEEALDQRLLLFKGREIANTHMLEFSVEANAVAHHGVVEFDILNEAVLSHY